MTVPKYRRDSHEDGTKEDFQDATTAAEALFKHTLTKTGGKAGREYFNKSDTFTRRIPLQEATRRVFHLCKKANRIVPRQPKHYKVRYKLLMEAYCTLEDVYTYLTTFNEERHIQGIEYWVSIIVVLEKLLGAWIKSDEEHKQKMKAKNHALRTKLKQSMEELKKMPYGKRHNTDKHAVNQWLRSPNVGNANNVRNVNTSGALNNNNARNGNAVAPDYDKSQTE